MRLFLLGLMIIGTGIATTTQAAQTLHCTSKNQEKATIDILPTADNPELAIVNIELHITPVRAGVASEPGPLHLQGLLSAHLDQDSIFASGIVQTTDGPVINPDLIELKGYKLPDGSQQFELTDELQVLQRGYGLWLVCN